jgi:hypothetical protein
MADQVRAWKVWRSFQLALIVGGMAGMLTIGLTYGQFVGELEPGQSLLAGGAVTAGLTLVLTYVFDQVSKSVGSFRRAVKGEGQEGNAEKRGQR